MFRVVSFPKTGRTRIRYLFHMIGYHKIEFTHDGFGFNKPFDFNFSRRIIEYQNDKILFLARDPKDTIISLYYQNTKRDAFFIGTLKEFIRDETFGIKTMIKFYGLWLRILENSGCKFRIAHYEDFSEIALASILNFFSIELTKKEIHTLYMQSAFKKMKAVEQKNDFPFPWLRARDLSDAETFKCRQGKIGGYKDILDQSDIELINNEICKTFNPFLNRYVP